MTIAHTENTTSLQSAQLSSEHPRQVLVEGPKWGDAEFCGAWLQLAARANRLLREAKEEDPAFRQAIQSLEVVQILDFGIAATIYVGQFVDKEFYSFTIPSDDPDLLEFALMARMGFFVRTGNRYQMVLPTVLDIETVKAAHLAVARTEDEDWIHPERLVVDMPFSEATQLQKQLRAMDQRQRLAERNALLREAMIPEPKCAHDIASASQDRQRARDMGRPLPTWVPF